MKKSLLIVPGILVLVLLIFFGCNKKDPVEPCDKTGQICITNKLDSTATIQIVQMNHLFDLDRDFMECLVVTGDNPYNFKISCNTFYLDTTIMILSCDDLQLILE
ncbi:MAG: hypothetical protein HQ542_11535 [Bacteroidia bacterium]|nr:hypothetical protein [Bacteroidia bacterium]